MQYAQLLHLPYTASLNGLDDIDDMTMLSSTNTNENNVITLHLSDTVEIKILQVVVTSLLFLALEKQVVEALRLDFAMYP